MSEQLDRESDAGMARCQAGGEREGLGGGRGMFAKCLWDVGMGVGSGAGVGGGGTLEVVGRSSAWIDVAQLPGHVGVGHGTHELSFRGPRLC